MTAQTLNEKIRQYCDARGMEFRPWEVTPWEVDNATCPWPPGSAGAKSWPKAQTLRAKIIAELRTAKT